MASLSARRAWIEIASIAAILDFSASLSARRAWIEISGMICKETGTPVALRKESVDRNFLWVLTGGLSCVALRKESVDRNLSCLLVAGSRITSLSARRAWIEINMLYNVVKL